MTADPRGWSPIETGAQPRANRPTDRAVARTRVRLRRSRNPALAALDGGSDVFQHRMRDVLVGAVVLITPMVLLNLWTTVLAFDRLDAGGPALVGFDDDATVGIEEVTVLLAAVLASVTAAIVGVFAASILVGERFARATGLRTSLGVTFRRLPATLFAWLLGHWWVPLLQWWVITARGDDVVGRLLLVLVVALVASSFTLFVAPVMIAEEAGPFRALKRSYRLCRLRFGAASGFVTLATGIGALLLTGIALLPVLLETTGFVSFGDYTWLANGIAVQLAVFIVVPLVGLSTAQLYVEVRLDAEGMDLALEADAAFGARVAP